MIALKKTNEEKLVWTNLHKLFPSLSPSWFIHHRRFSFPFLLWINVQCKQQSSSGKGASPFQHSFIQMAFWSEHMMYANNKEEKASETSHDSFYLMMKNDERKKFGMILLPFYYCPGFALDEREKFAAFLSEEVWKRRLRYLNFEFLMLDAWGIWFEIEEDVTVVKENLKMHFNFKLILSYWHWKLWKCLWAFIMYS